MKYFNIITFITIAVLIVNSVSCQNNQNKTDQMNWKLIDFNNIPNESPYNNYFNAIGKYNFEQILAINEEHIVLVGNNEPESVTVIPTKQKEAIAFVSLDGGNTITKHNLGKGSINSVTAIDKVLFLTNNTSSMGKISSQLLKADLSLENWETVAEFNDQEIYNVNFFSDKIGIASFVSEDYHQRVSDVIKCTIDGGKNWSTIKSSGSKFSNFVFSAAHEIEFIENNQLIRLNFISGNKEILIKAIAPEGFTCSSIFKDTESQELYTFIKNEHDKNHLSIKYLHSQEEIKLPNIEYLVETMGDYFHIMIKNGIYYNYMWSGDKGKTWNTEKLRDFYLTPRPIEYFGKGNVFAFVTCFKGTESERGGRLGIRKATP